MKTRIIMINIINTIVVKRNFCIKSKNNASEAKTIHFTLPKNVDKNLKYEINFAIQNSSKGNINVISFVNLNADT